MLMPLIRDVVSTAPGRVLAALGLLVGRSLFEGFGLVLLVPLLGLVGFGDAAPGDSRAARTIGQVVEWLGGAPTIGAVLAAFLVLVMLRATLGYGFSVVAAHLREGYVSGIRCRLFDALVGADWAMLSSLARADIMSTLIGHTERMTGSTFALISMASSLVTCIVVSVRSGRGMGAVKRISYVEARPHKVLSFCW